MADATRHAGVAAQQLEAFRAATILRQEEQLGCAMLAVVEPLIQSLLATRIS